eukprot:m.40369 g.40369  ORF g.40369 m.40369 type:complete len:326 (+) comp9656_c0_seq1:84-1061(+)
MSARPSKRMKPDPDAAVQLKVQQKAPAASETATPEDLENDAKVLELCKTESKSASYIENELSLSKKALAVSLNRLISQNKLAMLNSSDGTIKFLVKNDEQVKLEAQLPQYEDRLIYQYIVDANNKGIWTKTLRDQSGLEAAVFKRVIARMERKKLIKKVYPVTAPKKPLYMLYDMKPDSSLTGGAWYTANEFDKAFIDMLNKCTIAYAKRKSIDSKKKHPDSPLEQLNESYFSASNLNDHIQENQISTETLGLDEIEHLMETLVCDGLLSVSKIDNQGEKKFKIRREPKLFHGILATPCGLCPVYDKCAEGSSISPSTCRYLDNW